MSTRSLASNSTVGSSSRHYAPPPLASRLKAACTKWRILQWGFWAALVIGVAVWTHHAASQKEENDFESAVGAHQYIMCCAVMISLRYDIL